MALYVDLFSYTANDVVQQNAFSNRLARFGFNLFTIFPVDLMHEIELGVWKSLLIHLLRILEAVDENLLHDLDRRSAILSYCASALVIGFVYSLDSVLCQLLDAIQSEDSPPTHQN